VTVYVNSTTTVRLVPNATAVVFRGHTYTPAALRIEKVSQDGKGGLHEVDISISNVTREVGAFVELNEMRGVRVELCYVNSANLADDDAAVLEERYEIASVQIKGSQFVTFHLGHDRINQHQFPGGRFLRDHCRWIYKSPECGYVGGLPSCEKILEGPNGCRAHVNVWRYGGFPLMTPVPGRTL
jgi:lambda family phage minor tail protein L